MTGLYETLECIISENECLAFDGSYKPGEVKVWIVVIS